MAKIDAVIFDVGRVLIDYSYEEFFRLLNGHGAGLFSEEEFADRVGLIEYEHGHIGNDEFLARLNAFLDQPLPEDVLIAAWNNLFTPVAAMLDFAGQLKDVCRVYLLSNTSAMHWDYLKAAYRLEDICHDLFASFEVGQMKPAPAIFHTAEERFSLNPARSLFIDDKQENVAGAMGCGWQGLWHRNPVDTRQAVLELVGDDL